MLEYTELLTYFHKFPGATTLAAGNELPKAGQRANAIGGKFQALREHLNQHASHSSYSHPSLSHLLTRDFAFRKMQEFVPQVLEANLKNLVLHHLILLQEAVIALERVDQVEYEELADSTDRLKNRAFDVYQVSET